MRPVLLAVILLVLTVSASYAQIMPSVGLSPGFQCRAAIIAAERGTKIPQSLLSAIARVESGRPDPATGQIQPWPWTINAEGQGMVFATKAEAIATVLRLQAQGIRSIDVGCMQVNLMHHPQAFASLEEAFDPAANARYAARFLTELFTRTGTWQTAAQFYHSATPERGEAYGRLVLAAWPEEARRAGTVRLAMAYGWFPPTHPRVDSLGMLAPSRTVSFRGPMARGEDGRLLQPSVHAAAPPHRLVRAN